MEAALPKIWTDEYFKSGNQYFWLCNYGFFRIINPAEFEQWNASPMHKDKLIFGVADANGDGEHEAYLYFDTGQDRGIYFQSNYRNGPPLKKIAGDFHQLLEGKNYQDVFITKQDSAFWRWFENSYHSSEFESLVPKGAIPGTDMRTFFRGLPGTFLSDHKEINKKEFTRYFENFGVNNLEVDKLFAYKPETSDLKEFVGQVNQRMSDTVFFVATFAPSGFWGIGNYTLLTEDQKKILDSYGLIR